MRVTTLCRQLPLIFFSFISCCCCTFTFATYFGFITFDILHIHTPIYFWVVIIFFHLFDTLQIFKFRIFFHTHIWFSHWFPVLSLTWYRHSGDMKTSKTQRREFIWNLKTMTKKTKAKHMKTRFPQSWIRGWSARLYLCAYEMCLFFCCGSSKWEHSLSRSLRVRVCVRVPRWSNTNTTSKSVIQSRAFKAKTETLTV